MNLGEFIIKIGTQGDTKALDEATKKMEEAEKKSRRLADYLKRLKEATSEHEKKIIKKNFAQQTELDRLKKVKTEYNTLNSSINKTAMTSLKMIGALKLAIIVLDRMGNSLLKANQMYITFEKQTDMSISRLNRMAGLARLSGMNLSPEQVAGDLQSLQQRIFRLGMTGEGSGIFAQLGMNPMGMKSDQFIQALRQRTRGMSGQAKSYILSELGLSQEWLNVLELTNKEFSDYLKQSQKLQLTEKERKQLAQYTQKQQMNNMRWELAKQKLLISVMPFVQQIMDATSKIALKVANIFEQNPRWLYVVKDILLLLAGGAVLRTISTISNLFKGLGALAGATALKGIAKKGVGAGLGALAGGPIGAVFSIAMGIWTIVDIFKAFSDKQDEDDEPIPEPTDLNDRYQYHNVNSNMTNNFFNNPAPQQAVINELQMIGQRYLETAYL